MRRLRRTDALRRMVRETRLSPDNFIQPLFAVPGKDVKKPVGSMPGVFQESVDQLVVSAKRAWDVGVPAVILFGIPPEKDAIGAGSWRDDGIVQQASRALKDAVPGLVVVGDLCFCEYTDHGHCGVLHDGHVHNDETLENLGKQAVSLARAGVDVIAPSGMMDGMVGAIRGALDGARFDQVPILSYAVKFASAFYGPFREAAESAPSFGDRRGYQMDPANAREGVREARLDVAEGADLLMVKPAGAYLDVIAAVKAATGMPLAAYQVSGEYSMIKAAAERGWIDGERAMLESLVAITRAGADLVITYFAIEAAAQLRQG
jgi:porphobilinogen synthase